MILNNVISICQAPRFFTLEEADELIPLVLKITEQNEGRVQKLLDVQRYFLRSGAPQERIKSADTEVGQILVNWGTKLTKLGCKVFGGGFVGFDSGSGFWSWHNGETKIEYFHGYLESPLQRRQIVRLQKVEPILHS